ILDSFYVPIPCRAPQVQLNDLNDERVVAYWDPPITSYEYEILNYSVASTPTAGIKQKNTSLLLPYLDDNTTYYVYSKCYCDDKGIKSESPWASTSYKTWALSVGDINGDNQPLRVYPNPVQDDMVISLKEIHKDATISITDVTGKVLKVEAVTGTKINLKVG